MDEGHTKYVWDANNRFKVAVDTKVIEICGDLRGDLTLLMHERVVEPVQDDQSLKTWRCQHSSVRELRKEGGKSPETRHSKAGSMNNRLFIDGSNGKYLLILDYDMKPHPTFLLAVLPFSVSEGEAAVDGGGRQYSDDISWY
ncbi:unnamed protein product [Hyaloperonospora brassicae]|uniref:Uncharacterized protein n=1 Tax=Hyaloperonospora brassicae TaxID=162125 RepID=A0AAV0T6W9_HYABA|nr:unnamed protein product [Hyaloperonospora brassicae]